MIAEQPAAPDAAAQGPATASRLRGGLRRALSPRNASALYVFVVIFVIFSLWVPDTFLAETTWRTLLDSQSVTALVAVALVVPLAAGAFNLAVGAEVGFGAILVAWLLSSAGLPVVPAIALTLVAGAVIGVVSGLLIIRASIDSFIATLGMSSILLAGVAWVSGGEQILGLSAGFQSIATTQILGITLPVYLMLVVAAVVWYGLERTPAGRRVYATGGNIEAARLAGVRTGTVIVASLAICGVLAAAAGTLVTSRIATGDPTVGPALLLPAFSAAFLGSTQFRGGRFNVWGTVVAVYVLATGVKGLQLAGAPVWIPDLFNGVALLVAVGLAKYHRTSQRAGAIGRLISRRRYAPEGHGGRA
jgi:ribose transport system permease protein